MRIALVNQLTIMLFHYIWKSSFGIFCAVTSHGINAGDVKKLQDAGIYTCNGLMMHTKKVEQLSRQFYISWIWYDSSDQRFFILALDRDKRLIRGEGW